MTDEQFHALCEANSFGAVARGECALIPRGLLKALVDAAEAAERERWTKAIGAQMPADFKDWHENGPAELPDIAAWVIQNLRADRDSWADQASQRAQDALDLVAAERERADSRRAELVAAWNELPDALRCHPGLKRLYAACQKA